VSANNPVIPRTPLQKHYRRVCDMSIKERIAHADLLLTEPDVLSAEFAQSVDLFDSYHNLESFYSNKDRTPPTPSYLGRITKTPDVAWYLSKKPKLTVSDAPDLSAEYVDYEIAPTRTSGRAQFDDDGGSWRTGPFIDLVMANYVDRTPIIAELKIQDDKDPFTALIQVLASAALCVSQSQYSRFRNYLQRGRFKPNAKPRVDAYILLHRFLSPFQADLKRLGDKSEELSRLLMTRAELSVHVRRIACLHIELDTNSEIVGRRCWRHDS
jgi:hypothetical protein